MTEKSVNQHIATGAVWMLMLRMSIKGIGIISTMILARLLMPEDFGLVALAGSVYALIELIRAFGFDMALIQNQHAGRKHYDTAWSFQLLFSLVSALLMVVLAPFAAEFYENPDLLYVLHAMAVLTLLSGFNNIGVVEFRKQFDFRREFLFNVSGKVISFCVTIPTAVITQSYWALLAGMLANRLTLLCNSYLMQEYRPRIHFSEWRSIFGFSLWLQINNILIYLNTHSQNFILGKTAGQGPLGLFTVAYEVATLATTELVAPINRAAYPGYAKVAEDREKLFDTYLKVLNSIAFIAAPAALGLSAVAPSLVPVVLGAGWEESIAVIQWVSAASLLGAMNTNAGYLYLSIARQKMTTVLMLVRISIFLPLLIILSSQSGALGAAQAFAFTVLLMFPVNLLVLRLATGLSPLKVIATICNQILAAAIMYLAVIHLQDWLAGVADLPVLISLPVLLVSGALIYAMSDLLLWQLTGRRTAVEALAIKKGMAISNRIRGRQGSK